MKRLSICLLSSMSFLVFLFTTFAAVHGQMIWRGTLSFPARATGVDEDSSGNNKFNTRTETISGTIEMYIEESFVPNGEDCYLFFRGEGGTTICLKHIAAIRSDLVKSKTDQVLLIGTGEFSANGGGGIACLDSKGILKKENSGEIASIGLSGKIFLGIDGDSIVSGSFKTTLVPAGEMTKTGATLKGNVINFADQAAVKEKDLSSPALYMTANTVLVSVAGRSTMTDPEGNFIIYNVPAGDQTIIFAQGSASATYALEGVDAGETFILENVLIRGGQVTTEHTGFFVGTGTSSCQPGVEFPLTATIGPNGNSISGTIDNGAEMITWSGTENGTSVSGTTLATSGACVGEEGTFGGTFSGTTLSGTWQETKTVGSCLLCSGTFTFIKQ